MVRILLASDRVAVRNRLRALIEAHDQLHICAEAADSGEAFELVLQCRPEIAVLDRSLPALGDIEAMRQIRKAVPTTEFIISIMQASDDAIGALILPGAGGDNGGSEIGYDIVTAIEALTGYRRRINGSPAPGPVAEGERSPDRAQALTPREREVVRLIAEGRSNKSIARLLDISRKTVETHRSASMRKLDIHSTAEIVRYAIRNGLIKP